jgi:hypothetical protein
VVLVAGLAVIGATVFLPWLSIYGYSYSFLNVDSWEVLPVAQLVVVLGAGVGAFVSLHHVKRIGVLAGGSVLLLNIVGAIAGAQLANVHNTDQYFRIWAVLTVRPEWGGWLGLLACGVVLIGARSNWTAVLTVPDMSLHEDNSLSEESSSSARANSCADPESPCSLGQPETQAPSVPIATVDDGDLHERESLSLPHLDEVLALPKRPDRWDVIEGRDR